MTSPSLIQNAERSFPRPIENRRNSGVTLGGGRAIVAMLISGWISWHFQLLDSGWVYRGKFNLSRDTRPSKRDHQ